MDIRPYLVIPKLIEQPTWGGKYIVEYKGWGHNPKFLDKNFGQSYELSGSSKLSLTLLDTASPEFTAETDATEQVLALNTLTREDAQLLLGPTVFKKHGKMPLLIKFTQAKGNSFQLHKKPEVIDPKWLPKAESWYFFEDGYMTFGLKKGESVDAYKQTCIDINTAMQEFSTKIKEKTLTLQQARQEAIGMIQKKNPWQFVNCYHVPKFTMIDLSLGGLHHSWEEDPDSQFGNIVYEVQQDAADDASTLRSFDQGKIKDDGSIRPLTIDEYFRFLDTDLDHNDVEKAKQTASGTRILTTKNYFMDQYSITSDTTLQTENSFAHLFVMEGDVSVTAGNTTVRLMKGHSCLIPHNAITFSVHTNTQKSVIIRTGV